MTPVATSGLLCIAVGDAWSSSGAGSCWLEEFVGCWLGLEVAADCCCGLMVFALSPLKQRLSIASLSSGNIPCFWNHFFISAIVIDSQGSLNILVKLVLQQLIGLDVPNVANFKCVILLKCTFTGWNITTSSGWKKWVVWGGRQYKCILFSLQRLMISIFRCNPCPSRISNLGLAIWFIWGMNNSEIKP